MLGGVRAKALNEALPGVSFWIKPYQALPKCSVLSQYFAGPYRSVRCGRDTLSNLTGVFGMAAIIPCRTFTGAFGILAFHGMTTKSYRTLSGSSIRPRYPTEPYRSVRYCRNTLPNAQERFGTNSIPVPYTSVSSVRPPKIPPASLYPMCRTNPCKRY